MENYQFRVISCCFLTQIVYNRLRGDDIMIRLKQLREEKNWSMRDAAIFLKKPYTTYVNHEKELREPSSEDLKTYAKAYGVSVDYLLGRTDEKSPFIPLQTISSEELILINCYRKATDKEKESIQFILKDYK